eukprot:COSAG05_NODE_243_length_13035_cov_115.270022_9_plen_57_part_00
MHEIIVLRQCKISVDVGTELLREVADTANRQDDAVVLAAVERQLQRLKKAQTKSEL